MANQQSVFGNESSLVERVTRVETAMDTERPHLATKADLERHTRLIVMWLIATQIAVAGLILTVLGNWISTIR